MAQLGVETKPPVIQLHFPMVIYLVLLLFFKSFSPGTGVGGDCVQGREYVERPKSWRGVREAD